MRIVCLVSAAIQPGTDGETTMGAIESGYVTDGKRWAIQIPADNQWGFVLETDDQSFPGGHGLFGEWQLVPQASVPAAVVEELGWILDEARSEMGATADYAIDLGRISTEDLKAIDLHKEANADSGGWSAWRGTVGGERVEVAGIDGRYGVVTNGDATWTDANDEVDAVRRVVCGVGEVVP
jgi:hypothetical protein